VEAVPVRMAAGVGYIEIGAAWANESLSLRQSEPPITDELAQERRSGSAASLDPLSMHLVEVAFDDISP
jgi:hypothetical protein